MFITLMLWVYLLLLWITQGRRKIVKRLEQISANPVKPSQDKTDSAGIQKPLQALIRKASASWLQKRSEETLNRLQTRLAQAGNPGNLNMVDWVGIRLLCVLVGSVLGIILLVSKSGLMGLLLSAVCILLAGILPEFWLSKRITLRTQQIVKQLPSTLDLLTVSVEAGLGFDQAISRISEKLEGPLGDEFDRVLKEMQVGSSRSAALSRLSTRTATPEVHSFVSAVLQADKLGLGLVQVLRVQSAETRRKRRMDAEERAMKAPIKMLFPLVIFVFPALFIIILGPAVIHMIQLFAHSTQ